MSKEHTYPLPLDRMVEVYADFASTRLEGDAKAVTPDQVKGIVAALDEDGEVIPVDKERYNIAGIDDFAVQLGMHVLSLLIFHGIVRVGRLGWKSFWGRPKEAIIKDTGVPAEQSKRPTVEKAIDYVRDSDPDQLAKDWQGPKKGDGA